MLRVNLGDLRFRIRSHRLDTTKLRMMWIFGTIRHITRLSSDVRDAMLR